VRDAAFVLVPGLDGTALLFYRQTPILARRFHVETFPLPDDSSCTMESLVAGLKERVDRIAREQGEGRVFLCGESFGGALSLSFALRHPESVSGLVILNSFPCIRQRVRIRLGPALLKLMPWGAMPAVRRFTESRLHSAHTRREDVEEFHRHTRAIGRRGYIRRLEILRGYDIRDELHRIEVPTLFLAADEDQLVPSVAEARFMAARMPRATVRVLEGYGHVCLIHHDFDLLAHVDPWLDEAEASP
jgi:pimeloyl-ACP methyl ester carboxylesterase